MSEITLYADRLVEVDLMLTLKQKAFWKWLNKNNFYNPKNGSIRSDIKKNTFDFIYKKIYEYTYWVDNKYKIQYRIKLIRYQITPWLYYCPVCGADRFFSKTKGGFYWSIICRKKDKDHISYKKRHALLKRKKTFLENYGVDNPMKNLAIKAKNKEAHRKKYNGHFFSSPEFRNLNITQPMHNQEIREKLKRTNLERYGVECVFSSKKIQEKIRETNLAKYGVDYKPSIHIKNKDKFNDKDFIESEFLDKNSVIKMDSIKKYFNITDSTVYRLLHKLGIDFSWRYAERGFDPNKSAVLYYLYDPQEDLYKIGITNKTIEERFGKNFCVDRAIAILEQTHYEKGEEAYLAEQEILQAFSEYRCVNPSWPEDKGGKTEFFKIDVLKKG